MGPKQLIMLPQVDSIATLTSHGPANTNNCSRRRLRIVLTIMVAYQYGSTRVVEIATTMILAGHSS